MVGLGSYFASDPSHWFNYISMTKHYQSFTRGVFDSADIIYYLLFIVTFLTLTVRRLDSDRLEGMILTVKTNKKLRFQYSLQNSFFLILFLSLVFVIGVFAKQFVYVKDMTQANRSVLNKRQY